MDLRVVAERDLANPFRDWGQTVTLVDPDGEAHAPVGQVFSCTATINPDTGEEIVVQTPFIKLRRSTLDRIPVAGETWFVRAPIIPGGDDENFVIDSTRPPEGSKTLGIVKLYLQRAVQS